MPDAVIDLFTDQDVSDPVFDKVHVLSTSDPRPKIEALIRSRFDRSVYLDADTLVLTDISDLFRLLDRFDFAASHEIGGNHLDRIGRMSPDIPLSFPEFNSGVIALRKTPASAAFLERWRCLKQELGFRQDQPALRAAAFGCDIALSVLPPAYNKIEIRATRIWTDQHGAPRILHHPPLHKADDPGDPEKPFELEDLCPPRIADHIRALLRSDFFAGGDPNRKVRPLRSPGSRRRS